jgi:hypothetical protein
VNPGDAYHNSLEQFIEFIEFVGFIKFVESLSRSSISRGMVKWLSKESQAES